MAKRSIDMLPLLDVFMVVLFVFATIQEEKLDSTVQEREALAATAAAQSERLRAIEAERAELGVELERSKTVSEQLRQQLDSFLAINPDAKVQAEMATLHERLLDNVAVFEVELQGQLDRTSGGIRNLCCFRADPPTGAWQACGEIPKDEAAQLAWLADGGEGLIDGLNRTRGGNAVVLLSQGDFARYRLSNDVAELLRGRFPDYRIYDDGTIAGAVECPLLDAPEPRAE